MENKERRDLIVEAAQMNGEDIILLDNPYFDNSIIGITDDCRLIYSYSKMVEELAQDDDISPDEAAEFIDYNTLRAIPYMGEHAPIIMYPMFEEVEK